MFSMSRPQPVSTSLNGSLKGGLMEHSNGTINPAALASGLSSGAAQSMPSSSSPPRGTKRSRSPEYFGLGDEEDAKRRKRGRPPKIGGKVPESPTQPVLPSQTTQTPQLPNQALPQTSPAQASPTKSTPTKGTVVKALPTVRDHTTDQLNEEKDEYIPREHDPAGEQKVAANGALQDGRQYRCRTFYVPNRGEKFFMLATECARVLGYRDSYLLFNKNRSLHKIIANQPEKDDLIAQEILPYSYRSRQIAIVTARSMFRQFGSRLIVNGRRVRDDYWEGKAIKQGFTEDDAAGEKRPGAAKAREQATAEAAHLTPLVALPQTDVTYTHVHEAYPPSTAPFPMMPAGQTDDMHRRDYSNVQRPRQEMTGVPYVDRTGSSSQHEIMVQAGQAAEFNRSMSQQSQRRRDYLKDVWNRQHESPDPAQGDSVGIDNIPSDSQAFHSPQMPTATSVQSNQVHGMMGHPQHGVQAPQMMTPHAYSAQPPPPSSYVAQSPVRQQSLHLAGQQHSPQVAGGQQHPQPQRSPSMSLPGSQHHSGAQYPGYGGAQGMWPPPQPQPSPLSHQHHPGGMPQYASQHMGAQQSPHMAQRHNSIHGQQHQQTAPQLHHSTSTGNLNTQMGGHQNPYANMAAQGMGFPQGMNPYGTPAAQQRAANMYGAGGTPTPQQFLAQQHGGVSQAGGQGATQGWAGQASAQQWPQGGF